MGRIADIEERRRSAALKRAAANARERQFARLYAHLDSKPCDKCERCSKCTSND